jgi:hypothetical protein
MCRASEYLGHIGLIIGIFIIHAYALHYHLVEKFLPKLIPSQLVYFPFMIKGV